MRVGFYSSRTGLLFTSALAARSPRRPRTARPLCLRKHELANGYTFVTRARDPLTRLWKTKGMEGTTEFPRWIRFLPRMRSNGAFFPSIAATFLLIRPPARRRYAIYTLAFGLNGERLTRRLLARAAEVSRVKWLVYMIWY